MGDVRDVLELLVDREDLGKRGIYFDVEDMGYFFDEVKDYIGSDVIYDDFERYLENGEAMSPFETVRVCRILIRDIRRTHMVYD